jgi:hypothetical protein
MAVTSNAPVASPAIASGESEGRFVASAADIVIEGYTFIVAPGGRSIVQMRGNARGKPVTIENDREKSHADAHIIPGHSDISMT